MNISQIMRKMWSLHQFDRCGSDFCQQMALVARVNWARCAW